MREHLSDDVLRRLPTKDIRPDEEDEVFQHLIVEGCIACLGRTLHLLGASFVAENDQLVAAICRQMELLTQQHRQHCAEQLVALKHDLDRLIAEAEAAAGNKPD